MRHRTDGGVSDPGNAPHRQALDKYSHQELARRLGDVTPRRNCSREAESQGPSSRPAAACGARPARPSGPERRAPRDAALRAEATARRPERSRRERVRTESRRLGGHLPARRLVLGALIAAALSCAAGLAEAQTTTVTHVGSNRNNADTWSATEFVQNFSTGSQRGGYPLTSLQLNFFAGRRDSIDVSVCSADSNDAPTATCTALTRPGSLPGGEVTLAFTAPPNTVLEAGTTYALHITQSNRRALNATTSTGEDSGALAGRSIDNGHRRLVSGFWPRETNPTRVFRIAIRHTHQAPTAADSTVTTLEDTPYVFRADGFNFSGGTTNAVLAGVTVVTPPDAGAMRRMGSW